MSYNYECLCKACAYTVDASAPPALEVNCWCEQCRIYSSKEQALAVFDPKQMKFTKGEDNLISYESTANTFRKSCKTCGSFVTKTLGNGMAVIPIYAVKAEGGATQLAPKCHIFCAHAGPAKVPDDGLPKHDEFP